MATQLELAVLTYDSYTMTPVNRLPLQGWTADHDPDFNDSSWSGFGATVYTRGSEVVIAFRGTDGNMDWMTANPQAASGAYSLQAWAVIGQPSVS
jgi:hypothetical protein